MKKVDVHIVVSQNEPWFPQCFDSLKNEPVNIFYIDAIPGHTSAARTLGFLNGDSEYVSFVDPDDEVIPGIFSDCIEILEKDKSLSGVYTDEILINANGEFLNNGWSMNPPTLPWLQELHQGIHHLRVLRRSAVMKCLPLKTKRMPEIILMHEIKKCGPLHHLNKIGYKWRIHGSNTYMTYTVAELIEAMSLIGTLKS